jgi:DNA-binding winged helix-turn-helix (wHTH) protein
MEAPASSRRRVRAGLFEVDLGCGEIHKSGRKVRLQEQPFRVLAILLERPGEIITREELQARVWPADTFVGFDEGINTAIRKLRVAFGDSADNPRFVETIPRRGYRFVAPVHDTVAEPAQPLESVTVGDAALALPRRLPRNVPWLLGLLSVAALLVALASVTYLRRSHPPASSLVQKRVMLAILPFQNMSNDPGKSISAMA